MTSQHREQGNAETPGEQESGPSRSQRKREALAVRSLAAQLIDLAPAKLRRMPIEPDVLDEILVTQKMRSHGARKRQLQFVAKKMRLQDTAEIEQALEDLRHGSRQEAARQHRCEAWRDHLAENGDRALEALMSQRPGIDAQAIRQLQRKAAREMATGKPPAGSRALFRHLFELDAVEPLPPLM